MGRPTDVIMGENGKEMKTGTWTDEEHEQFLKGFEKVGKDFKALQEFIPTRTALQIRTHCNHHMDLSRKRKVETEETSSKKPKATPSKEKLPAKEFSKPQNTRPHTAGPAKVASAEKKAKTGPAKIASSEKKAKTVEEVNDIIPPPSKVDLVPPVAAKKVPSKPARIEPTVAKDTATIIEDDVEESKIASFLSREEVQTVIAGLAGFFIVLFVKKYVV